MFFVVNYHPYKAKWISAKFVVLVNKLHYLTIISSYPHFNSQSKINYSADQYSKRAREQEINSLALSLNKSLYSMPKHRSHAAITEFTRSVRVYRQFKPLNSHDLSYCNYI